MSMWLLHRKELFASWCFKVEFSFLADTALDFSGLLSDQNYLELTVSIGVSEVRQPELHFEK